MKYKLLLFIKNKGEPKHVAPCSPLFLKNNSNLYFIVCDWRFIVLVYEISSFIWDSKQEVVRNDGKRVDVNYTFN